MKNPCEKGGDFSTSEVDQLKALSDPLRLDIYVALSTPRTVTEVAHHLGLDRKALYHHVKILKNADLIQEVDSKFVKNLKEVVYQKSDGLCLNILPAILWNEAGSKILHAIQNMADDEPDAEYRDEDSICTVSRKRMKVKAERLGEVQAKIIEYREEYARKVLALADEGPDLREIEIMCVFFDK